MDFFDSFHLYVGYGVPGGFVLLVLWAVVSTARNRAPHDAFWTLLAVLQVVVVIQFVVGGVLFLSGARPPTQGAQWRHYMYGALIPALALMIAHRQARKLSDIAPLIFGIAGFFCAASTAMALMTGLGIF